MSSYLPNFFKAYLATALPAGVTSATIVLDRVTTLTGETIETADLSLLGKGVLTINSDGDGITSYPENASFTGITAATKTLSGVKRGIDKAAAENTIYMRYHPVGTPVIISFGTHQIADLIAYINSLVVSTRSVIVAGTAGETLVAGNLVYFSDADDEWMKCDADIAATVENAMLGIAQGAGVNGGQIATGVLILGKDLTNSGLTAGTKYYASNTAGGISTSVGTKEVTIGWGTQDGYLYFEPRFDQQLTEDQQDALAGDVGTPSATNLFVTAQSLAAQNINPVGMISPYGGISAPVGWLICDGTAVSRATYATLFPILNPSLGTVTVTIASPGVFSFTSHGLKEGDTVYLTTTGALPTGLAVNTLYYVIAGGLTANAFELSATRGGSVINTSGSQSGVHTLRRSPYGLGDGSTTFNVPSLTGKVPVGRDSTDTSFALGESGGEKTHTLTIAEMPAHSHDWSNSQGTPGGSGAVPSNAGGVAIASPSQGSGTAHNNLQPYVTVNYIIKT